MGVQRKCVDELHDHLMTVLIDWLRHWKPVIMQNLGVRFMWQGKDLHELKLFLCRKSGKEHPTSTFLSLQIISVLFYCTKTYPPKSVVSKVTTVQYRWTLRMSFFPLSSSEVQVNTSLSLPVPTCGPTEYIVPFFENALRARES
jgi:hypothetical protein